MFVCLIVLGKAPSAVKIAICCGLLARWLAKAATLRRTCAPGSPPCAATNRVRLRQTAALKRPSPLLCTCLYRRNIYKRQVHLQSLD